ncbi:PREDICTED: cyclin-dependent kinase 9-like [Polistes canadensis]|uniref:cyclin-dependent kinase 9-like n=1 Tax=Polistes canadensis TaxID=91411 RepID=UPI000718E7CC|nr:PREDICTED: cyclin-dependent kinase 9-like [Polistes canadensis]
MNRKEKEKYIQDFNFPYCKNVIKYKKIVKIGQGTFGEVFKGIDTTNPNKFVALKKILTENKLQEFPRTALREITLLKALNHENVIKLIEVCRTKGTLENQYETSFYIVLEFCEHDLAGLLSNPNVKFTLGEIKKVLQQILNGLFYIHKRQVIHRDIKSANILITKNGILKIADFGLARWFSEVMAKQTKGYTNKVVTLWYRPPELLLGSKMYGPPIDIWGVGCIMAEMWIRMPLMRGDTEQKQLLCISQLCGSITKKVWPKVTECPLYNKMNLPEDQTRKVKERLGKFIKDSNALDLLDNLLLLDPDKRIDTNNALDHDFFWTDPMPCELNEMLAKHSQSMFEFLIPRRSGNIPPTRVPGGTSRSSSITIDSKFQDRIF